MVKYIVGIVGLLIIGAGGYYFWSGRAETPTETAPTQYIPMQVATTTYATSTYSVIYPQNFTKDELYAYTAFEKKPINGVKFSVPMEMATGTNLSADSYIAIEQLPRAQNCTGDIYLLANVKAIQLTEGTTVYSIATSSEAGAGNLYEEQVYALADSDPCTAVRYFIHSTNIENFEAGVAREYDRAALLKAFDEIRRSLTFTR